MKLLIEREQLLTPLNTVTSVVERGRNRLKRRVRESFRYHKQPLAGLDLVVIARQEANETECLQVDRSLFGHWIRVKEKCGK